jgi:hypothetical protein
MGQLRMEATNIWRLMELTENKNDWRAQSALQDRLMRIHIRHAKLLGLDAPTKLDVSGIYQRGGADLEAEQRAREAVIEALPIEEQRRIYDFYQAGLRAKAGDLSQPAIARGIGSSCATTCGLYPPSVARDRAVNGLPRELAYGPDRGAS